MLLFVLSRRASPGPAWLERRRKYGRRSASAITNARNGVASFAAIKLAWFAEILFEIRALTS
jgi:hypothetical protein